tara:strand:+ start:351 stop:1058 length:708 start_codon:yes stop_codon:yes gene_type:complete
MAVAQFLEGTAFGVLNDVLSAFRSNEGYALPSRYEVLIIPPAKIGGGNQENIFANKERGGNTQNISLRAESVILPGRTLTTSTDSNIYGPDREIVEGVTFADEISVDFQASSGLDERVFFENWQRQAFNEQTFNIGYYRDYIGFMEVYLLDQQDRRRYGLRMEEVFPKTITASNLNYQAATEILKTNVQFTFRKWTNLDTNQTGNNVSNRIFNTVIRSVERNISRNLPRTLNRLL